MGSDLYNHLIKYFGQHLKTLRDVSQFGAGGMEMRERHRHLDSFPFGAVACRFFCFRKLMGFLFHVGF